MDNVKKWFVGLFALALMPIVYGQEFLEDTVFLEEVKVLGLEEESYAPGYLMARIPLDSARSTSLTETLLEEMPAAINQYGARGQLASINLRGLGASRTAVLWNNMPINSFTNGQVDLNLLPTLSGDALSIVKGSGSSIYGSGALAATLNIDSRPSFDRPSAVQFGHSLGSFGFNQSEFGVNFSADRFTYALKGQTLQADNDFEYESRGESVRQHNAAFDARNISQDLSWLLNKHNSVTMNLWYAENDRQIQPSRNNFSSSDQLFDRNFRGRFGYYLDKSTSQLEVNVGYSRDHQVYNNLEPLTVDQFFSLAQYEFSVDDKIRITNGIRSNLIQATGANFEGGTSEWRSDIYSYGKWVVNRQLHFGLNLRLPTVEGKPRDFSPAVSGTWWVLRKKKWQVLMEGQASRGFRLPTINDRFWNPGGNPDLRPEVSQGFDLGMTSNFCFAGVDIRFKSGAYLSSVENWILWRPGGRSTDSDGQVISFWFPENLKKVLARGLEIDLSSTYRFGALKVSLGYQNNLTRAENRIGTGASDRSEGKQIPFTPKYSSLSRLALAYDSWALNFSRSYVGIRYTEANNELPPLEAYQLYNLSLSKTLPIRDLLLMVKGSLRNLLNEDYESYDNRAMPGINYDITLKINYTL